MRSLQSQMGLCQRIQVILGAAAVAAVILFYFVGYRPATSRLESLGMEIDARTRELEQNRNKTSNMEYLAREVRRLEKLAETYDRQFPRQAELGQFIKEMTHISQQLSLQEWKFEPCSPRRGDSYFELPIAMHFRGNFLNAASFLRQVEDMQRLTRVKKIEMKSRDEKAGIVQVEMTMSIYFSEG